MIMSAHGPGHAMSGGKPGDAAKATRTVEIVAIDNAFSLTALQVRDGGPLRHPQRRLRDARVHDRHRPRVMSMDHDDGGVTVLPGETATLVWTFARAVNLQFA